MTALNIHEIDKDRNRGLAIEISDYESPEQILDRLLKGPKEDHEQLLEAYKAMPQATQRFVPIVLDALRQHLGQLLNQGADEGAAGKLENHGRQIVRRGAAFAKQHGTVPGNIGELIEAFLRPPVISWAELFAALVQKAHMTKRERGMRKPSKTLAAVQRHLKRREGLLGAMSRRMALFPGTTVNPRFTVTFVVDTSGSMAREDLQMALSELQHIQRSASEMSIRVIYADTQVQTDYELRPGADIDWTLTGRGGTDFDEPLRYVAEQFRRGKGTDLVVYATDGYAPAPTTKVPVPVVWLLTPRGQKVMEAQGHTTLFMRPYTYEELED